MTVHHVDRFKRAWSKISTRHFDEKTVKLDEKTVDEKTVARSTKRAKLDEKTVAGKLDEKAADDKLGEKAADDKLDELLGEKAADDKLGPRRKQRKQEKTVEDIMLSRAFRLKSKYLSVSGQAMAFIGAVREDSQFKWISEEIMEPVVAAQKALQQEPHQINM
jgi:hypothetical protein